MDDPNIFLVQAAANRSLHKELLGNHLRNCGLTTYETERAMEYVNNILFWEKSYQEWLRVKGERAENEQA